MTWKTGATADAWQVAAAAGIPRDGGIADLLSEAKSPTPISRSWCVRTSSAAPADMYNSLKLERELQDQGIPIFATDEPFNIEGINATTVLVRRVKQGVAEWYRLQLKGKVWDGLKEHSLAGWNLGKVPIGYTGQKHPHPNPDQGRRRPHQNPAHRRPGLRAGHHPASTPGGSASIWASPPSAPGWPPTRTPTRRPARTAGPSPWSMRSCPTPSTPATR